MAKHSIRLVLSIGISAIILATLFRFSPFYKSGSVTITTSSALMQAINIAELSTAEFRYRGIAEVYKDKENTDIQCRVCYNAIVKAVINTEKIKIIDINEKDKIVTAKLPDITLKVRIVDEQSMPVLPSDADVDIGTMIECSKEDAEREARESKELIDTAQESLKATIEGLWFSVLNAEGYSLVWT